MKSFIFHIFFLLGALAMLIHVLMRLAKNDLWQKKSFIPIILSIALFILLLLYLSPLSMGELIRNSLIFIGSGLVVWLVLVATEF